MSATSLKLCVAILLLGLGLGLTGCMVPVGARLAAPVVTSRQIDDDPLRGKSPSGTTLAVLGRFDQVECFARTPDLALARLHDQAVADRDRDLLFALAELNYLTGERLRHGVKPWEARDARDYYLVSAIYAWFFLFGDAALPPPGAFDRRFRAACDLYNSGLGWALTARRSTNAVAILAGGTRPLPFGHLEVAFTAQAFPWPVAKFERFILADQLLVRGLSVRNRQAGLGAALVAVSQTDPQVQLTRSVPATVFLRIEGRLSDLAQGRCRGSLELYSSYDAATVQVGGRTVPLESDTTAPLAYNLNQTLLWRLGMLQFLSHEERIPSDVYANQPYERGKVPVVFVHGTFSSPVYWAEMVNTLSADPELRKRCQFWQFVYNSGNPTMYSAVRLREALAAKVKALDPDGTDPALRQMVVIGHSQGGLLAKLTATDTREELLGAILKTKKLEDLKLTTEQDAMVHRYLCFEALPFVQRVIFISTPHRGSYLASSFTRRLARKFVSLPSTLVNLSSEFAAIREQLDLPREIRGVSTSLDSMSTKNPVQLKLASIPLAPGVQGHSIVAVQGEGDFRKGKDGLVAYDSAHIDYAESEVIVRGPHSCQSLPPTIIEVHRILRAHVSSLPSGGRVEPAAKPAASESTPPR